jgi:hypothetical protein
MPCSFPLDLSEGDPDPSKLYNRDVIDVCACVARAPVGAMPCLALPCLALPCLPKRTPLPRWCVHRRTLRHGCRGAWRCSYLAFSRDCTTWDFTTVYAEQPFVARKPGQGMLMA